MLLYAKLLIALVILAPILVFAWRLAIQIRIGPEETITPPQDIHRPKKKK